MQFCRWFGCWQKGRHWQPQAKENDAGMGNHDCLRALLGYGQGKGGKREDYGAQCGLWQGFVPVPVCYLATRARAEYCAGLCAPSVTTLGAPFCAQRGAKSLSDQAVGNLS